MEASLEVAIDIKPLIIVYKDGRVQRLVPIVTAPPSVDATTGVTSKDVVIDPTTGLSARLYLPDLTSSDPAKKLPVFVYYHGGGFVMGSAFWKLYQPFLNTLVAKAKVVAVSVDYRLAPEHPIPAAYDDCWNALQWVISHVDGGEETWLAKDKVDFSRVFLAGDTAGGNIVNHVVLRMGASAAHNGVTIEGAVLVSPYFWGTEKFPSEQNRTDGPLAPPENIEKLWPYISGTGHDDPRINPLVGGAQSLASLGCRRVFVEVAEKDTYRDRGRAYSEGLKASGWGGAVELHETEGEDHLFFMFKPGSEKACKLMENLVGFINKE